MAIHSVDQLPAVFGVEVLQEFLDLCRASAYALVNRPDFPKFRVGKRIRIYKAPFLLWLDEQARPKAS